MTLAVYKASAGSGKTFILTQKYILLAIKNPSLYKHILAVTFTNKATEEMKNRITNELFLLSTGQESPHLEIIENELNINRHNIKDRAKKLLNNILYNYNYFEISTIDSFFQKIIRNFSHESGIKYGYNVELDTKSLLKKVISELMFSLNENPQLTQWLIDFAEDRINEGKSWNTRDMIERFSNEILKEEYQENETKLLNDIKEREKLKKFTRKLNDIINHFENELEKTGKEAIALIEQHNLQIDDFKYKKSGVAGHFLNLATKKKFEPGSRAILTANEKMDWHNVRGAENIQNIENCINNGLRMLLIKSINFYHENRQKYFSSLAIKNYLKVLGIVTDISDKLGEIRTEENLLAISDINLLLKKIIEDNDVPFIYEKTGSHFKHYLIDEFQDTSGFQWINLKPLLLNSLAQNDSNLIVGDVKQSIYRWRNGDWRLLLEKIYSDIPKQQIVDHNLEYNWRSKENIIQFNNSIFSSIPIHLKFDYEKDNNPQNHSEIIEKAYKEAIQKVPDQTKKDGGFVRVEFFEQDNGQKKDYREKVKPKLIEQIDELIAKGYKSSDIAILVRKSADGYEISETILESKRYRIISNDSLYLKTSISVRIILAALSFLNEPSDRLNLVLLKKLLYQAGGVDNPDHKLYMKKIDLFEKETDTLYHEKKQENVYEIVGRIIQEFELNNMSDQPFIHAFEDMVLDYCKWNNPDIVSFLEWWKENEDKKTISLPGGQDAITIMTIHKSKGLDFPVVILPFCDWETDHSPLQQNILWVNTQNTGFDEVNLLPVKYGKTLENTFFSDAYFDERLYAGLDSLNLLYVALTRAKEGLIVFGPLNKKNDNISAYLHKSITSQVITDIKGRVKLIDHYEDGKNRFLIGEIPDKKEQTLIKSGIRVQPYQISSQDRSIRINKQYEGIFNRTNLFEDSLNYGRIMHLILSEIKYEMDLERSLNQFLFDGIITREESKEIKARIRKVLKDPVIKNWFSGEWKVITEKGILTTTGNIRIPDRVMIKDKDAVIIDFKFGEKHQSHKKQINEYCQLIGEMGYQARAFLLYLDNIEIEEVK